MKFSFLFYISFISSGFCQKETSIWFINDGVGLEFFGEKIKERFDSQMNVGTLRGNITLCDSAGKLQFYSDGISVWNNKHQKIATDLHGELNISAVPYPSRQGVYLLFYTGRVEKPASYPLGNAKQVEASEIKYLSETEKTQKAKLYYSILDLNTGTFLEKNIVLLENALSDICIARHAENGKYWLVAHEANNAKFLAYSLDKEGINREAITSNMGAVRPAKYDYIMKTTIKGDKVLLDKIGVDSGFEVFDFDNQKGIFTQLYSIVHADKTFFVWSYEFSPNGKFIYTIFHSENNAKDELPKNKETGYWLYQYDLTKYLLEGNVRVIKIPNFEKSKGQVAKTMIYGSSRPNSNLQLSINSRIYLLSYIFGSSSFIKPNEKIEITKYKSNIVSLMLNPLKFGGKPPKISHLLPLSLIKEEEELKVGKPFTRPILFDSNQSILKPLYEIELEDIVIFLKENPKATIEISGHTDNEGEAGKNQKLSQDRAQALANFLISKQVGKERIKAIGYGSSKPIADNNTPESKAKNRRIEFLISEKQ